MKRIITQTIILAGIVMLVGCKNMSVTVPNYVSASELSKLTVGSNKEQVKQTLGNQYPFDIYTGGNLCEVHQYKYKVPAKLNLPAQSNKYDGLTNGKPQMVEESDAYLVYKEGKLQSMVTNAGKKDLERLLNDVEKVSDLCTEKGLRGCTDPMSINYNPDAIVSDGSCEYCPCNYIKNPNFNPNQAVSDCNSKCVPANASKKDDKGCSNCDIIEKLSKSANVNLNINMDGGKGGNSNSNNPAKSLNKKTKASAETDSDEAGKKKIFPKILGK